MYNFSFIGFCSQGVVHRRKEDILSRFLIESEKDPENMTDKYLRDITLNFIIAGRDTSGNSLTWFFYMLCKNPSVQKKIVNEVREVTNINTRQLPFAEFCDQLTEHTLDKMHYLHAALTETMRLYPAVPLVTHGIHVFSFLCSQLLNSFEFDPFMFEGWENRPRR